jgi:uncharacterized protein (TIGR02996 family)
MNQEAAFLEALLGEPGDTGLRLVFADWLEERGDPRGELLRLTHALTQDTEQTGRQGCEERLRALLAEGVRAVGPFRTDPAGMTFAWVPPGTFLMGSPPTEEGRSDDETQHRVTLSKGFWLGITPVTQAQWRAVMGTNPDPSRFKGDDRPVERVPWHDCVKFCKKLSKKEGRRYRLPTEAEWEYACRAGTTTPFSFGQTISTDQANYDGNDTYGRGKKGAHRQQTTPVGSFPANAWGLFDMHGNVWEWCQDWYGAYPSSDTKDPQDSNHGEYRVVRGCSWCNAPNWCRSASRSGYTPASRWDFIGCRVVLCLD